MDRRSAGFASGMDKIGRVGEESNQANEQDCRSHKQQRRCSACQVYAEQVSSSAAGSSRSWLLGTHTIGVIRAVWPTISCHSPSVETS